jgi:raffinose/stachyose/melibiose transport system substrate-binding protein
MKKAKRLLAVVLSALMTSTLIASCGESGGTDTSGGKTGGGDSGKTVEIRLLSGWTTSGEDVSPDSVLYNKKIDEFNAENNGVKIINEPSAGDDKRNKARLDVTANNACDIWHFWGGSILNDYVAEGVLADCDAYFAESEKVKKEDYAQEYIDFDVIDGVNYGVPFTLAVSVFMVNKDIFAECGLTEADYPKTVSDLKKVSKIISDKGYAATNVGSKGGNPSHFWFSDYVVQQEGGKEAIEDMLTSYQFDTPQNRKAMEVMADMAASKVFPSDTMANGDWSPSFELFTQGKAGMCYTFNWMFTQFPEEMLDKVEIIPVPALDDGDISTSTFQEGWINDANVMLKKSWDDPEKHDAVIKAFDFINWDIPVAGAEAGAIVSPNSRITESIDYSNGEFGLLGEVMQWRVENDITGRPNHWANCANGDLQAFYQSTLDEVWSGSISADDAMTKIQKKFDEEKAKAGA